GAMRALIEAQLADARERGQPLAALHASEATIYGHFGFGPATLALGHIDIDTARGEFRQARPVAGRMRLIDRERALDLLPPIHERALESIPGDVARDPEFWRYQLSSRRSPLGYVVVHE